MKLNAQISRINAASNNVGNAISFSQTQDGYISKVSDALSRMSELSVLSQDATKTDSDREVLPPDFFAYLRREYDCDGVLFVELTAYRACSPAPPRSPRCQFPTMTPWKKSKPVPATLLTAKP